MTLEDKYSALRLDFRDGVMIAGKLLQERS